MGFALATSQVSPTLNLNMSKRLFPRMRSTLGVLARLVNMYQNLLPSHARPFTSNTTQPSIGVEGDSERVSTQWRHTLTNNIWIWKFAKRPSRSAVSPKLPWICYPFSILGAAQ